MVIDLSTVDPRERPVLVLETIGGKIIAPLMTAVDIKLELNYNEASKLSFKISQSVDGIATPGYDQIAGMNVIDVQGYGRFILVKPSVAADGATEIKSCSAYSLEYEMSYKNITVANGTYRLWDELDSSGTLLGMICQKMTSWTVASVDPILLTRYRTMEAANTRIYDFIKNTIQESFGCIFDFDTYNRTIRVVSVDTTVDTQPIYLSTDNLLKEIEIKEDDDDVVTCLTVCGAEGVDIRSVNPMGTSSLYNLDHYMTTEHFDQAVIDKWAEWKTTYEAAREEYYRNTIELYLTVARISTEQAKLTTLKGEMVALENVQAVYIEGISTNLRTQEELDAKNAEVAAKQSEINEQESLIAELQNDLAEQTTALKTINQQTAFSSFFTAEEIKLLERYVIEGSLEDSTFVAPETASYTNKDIGAHLTNTPLSVTGSDMSVIESAGGKTIYSFKGGKVTLGALGGTLGAEIVRSVCDIADGGATVFTAYLASGTTDGTEDGLFTSGCISIVGTAGDIQSDKDSFSVVISEGDSYFTKNTTEFDKQTVEWDLYDYAAAVLARKAEPSYSFTVDCCNFLVREDFESFKNQLRLGKRCYLDIPHAGVKTPYVVSVTIEFDDPDDFSIEFGSNYSSSNDRFDLADLLEDSISVGKTVSLNTQNYSAFTESGAASTVQAYMTSALDLAKQAVQSSGEQAISWDDAGIRLRRWNDASHTSYDGKEIWMVNNNILFTTDNWQTAKMAIGELYDANLVSDDNPGGTAYGIVAPYIVGTMLAGQNLMIDTEDGSFRVGKDGCRLYNANFDIESEHTATGTKGILSLHPDYGFLAGMVNQSDSIFTCDESGKITGVRTWKNDSELGVAKIADIADGYNLASNFWIDMYGDVYMKGTVYATDGSFTGILDIGGGNFYVDSAGNVTMKGNINMSSGAIAWSSESSPSKVLYAQTQLDTPTGSYNSYASISTTAWHKTLGANDLFASYSYDGGVTWSRAVKISAKDGDPGTSVFIVYHENSADSTPPTPTGDGTGNGWHSDVRSNSVWMSQKVALTVDAGTWGVPIRIAGEDGQNGSDGKDGTNGKDGANGKDGVSPTVSITKNGTTTTISITDKDGTHTQMVEDGTNGTPGEPGDDGKTSYFHVKYSDDGGATFTANTGETVGKYIGTYVDFTEADSTSVSDYDWVKIEGENGRDGANGKDGENGKDGTNGKDGVSPTVSLTKNGAVTTISITDASGTHTQTVKDGEDGTPGTPGSDGRTPYFHVKYSDDGGASFTANGGETVGKYIGTCTDYNSSDPDSVDAYTWALIKGSDGKDGANGKDGTNGTDGEDGRGIASVTEYYARSASGTTAPTSWSTSVPTLTSTYRYLWNYRVVSYTDETSYESPKCVIKEHMPSYIQETYIGSTEIRSPTIKTNLLTIQTADSVTSDVECGLVLQGYYDTKWYDMFAVKYFIDSITPTISIYSPADANLAYSNVYSIEGTENKIRVFSNINLDSSETSEHGLTIYNGNSTDTAVSMAARVRATVDGRGNLQLYKSDGTMAVNMYANSSAGGELDLQDSDGNTKAALVVGSTGAGSLKLTDASGKAYTLTPALIQKLANLS